MSNMFAPETKIKLKLEGNISKLKITSFFYLIQDKPLHKCSDNFVPELLEFFFFIILCLES